MPRIFRLSHLAGCLLLVPCLAAPCTAQSLQRRIERTMGPVRSTSLVDGSLGAYGVVSNNRFRRRGQIQGIQARNEGRLTITRRDSASLAARNVAMALGGSAGGGAEYELEIFDVLPRDLLALLDSTVRAEPSTYAWIRGDDARVVTRVAVWVRGHDESSRAWRASGGSILNVAGDGGSRTTVTYWPNSIAFYQTERICWSADGQPVSIIPESNRCPVEAALGLQITKTPEQASRSADGCTFSVLNLSVRLSGVPERGTTLVLQRVRTDAEGRSTLLNERVLPPGVREINVFPGLTSVTTVASPDGEVLTKEEILLEVRRPGSTPPLRRSLLSTSPERLRSGPGAPDQTCPRTSYTIQSQMKFQLDS